MDQDGQLGPGRAKPTVGDETEAPAGLEPIGQAAAEADQLMGIGAGAVSSAASAASKLSKTGE